MHVLFTSKFYQHSVKDVDINKCCLCSRSEDGGVEGPDDDAGGAGKGVKKRSVCPLEDGLKNKRLCIYIMYSSQYKRLYVMYMYESCLWSGPLVMLGSFVDICY